MKYQSILDFNKDFMDPTYVMKTSDLTKFSDLYNKKLFNGIFVSKIAFCFTALYPLAR